MVNYLQPHPFRTRVRLRSRPKLRRGPQRQQNRVGTSHEAASSSTDVQFPRGGHPLLPRVAKQPDVGDVIARECAYCVSHSVYAVVLCQCGVRCCPQCIIQNLHVVHGDGKAYMCCGKEVCVNTIRTGATGLAAGGGWDSWEAGGRAINVPVCRGSPSKEDDQEVLLRQPVVSFSV